MIYSLFLTADSTIGRVDLHSLTDQMAMELLVEDFTENSKKGFQDADGGFFDVSAWKGVKCAEEGHVHSIEFMAQIFRGRVDGTIALMYLPRKIAHFAMAYTLLQGTLDTHTLPDTLEHFSAISNGLGGEVDLAGLPPKISEFTISDNEFLGSCNFSHLPSTLTKLDISSNYFTGELNLTELGQSLKVLDASRNKFSGEILLASLPATLEDLYLQGNQLRGSIDLHGLSATMRSLNLSHNRFSGVAVLPLSAKCQVYLRGLNVEAVVDENGARHPNSWKMLNVC